jgi:hypothetical protein
VCTGSENLLVAEHKSEIKALMMSSPIFGLCLGWVSGLCKSCQRMFCVRWILS